MPASRRLTFDISWKTLAKILVAAAAVWIWLQLWQFVMVILVSIFMAVALDPFVRMLEKRRIPRGVAAAGSVLLIVVIVAVMMAAGWVSITSQSEMIIQSVKQQADQLRARFPFLESLLPSGSGAGLNEYAMALAQSTSSAIGMLVIGLVLTVYLLLEYKQTVEWCLAFVPPQHRPKARQTLEEARKTVYGYVAGNVFTSIITAVATFVVLLALGVPAALVLALIAGLFDFIPVLGFILSAVLAAILASTVSTTAVVGVLVFYALFNVVENYLIAPKVYGDQLQLSNLAVLLAVAVGGYLGGVIGALLALPLAAIYPVVERIWLRDHLSQDTVARHDRLNS